MSSAGLSVGTLVGTIAMEDAFTAGLDKFANAIGISQKSMEAMAGAAGLLAGGLGVTAAAIVTLGQRGAVVADVQAAFGGLSSAAGVTADTMLGALREGTLGTISDFDLMQKSNGLLSSGLIKSSDDMKTLAAGAKLLADRTGGDTATAFDTLSGAIASGRTNSLKALGLFVDSKDAAAEYAAKLGKLPSELSGAEQAAGIAAATLGILRGQLADAGPPIKDMADLLDIGKVAVQNFTDDLGVAIATSPVVQAAMGGIASAVQDAFGGTQQDTVKTLRGYVDTFAIGVVTAAQVAVDGARVIVYAWDGVKAAFNAIVGFTLDVLGRLITSFGSLVTAATFIPGIGEKFKPVAEGITGVGKDLEHLSSGFYAQASAAVDSAADSKAAFDTVADALAKTKEEMQKAQGAAVELGDKAPTAIKSMVEPATLSKDAIKLIEKGARELERAVFEVTDSVNSKFRTLQDDLTLSNLTGVDARLFKIQQAHDTELAGIADLQVVYPAAYDTLAAMIEEKYGRMTTAAQGHFTNVLVAAEAAGFQTRAELETTAINANKLYDEMLASGKFSFSELQKAHKKAKDAEMALDNEVSINARQQFDLIANAAQTLISAAFGKNKIAAIATAIIDTAQAVVKALASAPPPLNYVLAGAVGLAGLIQINKIRSTEIGFAAGTVGTSFVDFGRGTATTLHGAEAVVTAAQGSTLGEVLSGMVRDALRTGGDRTVAVLENIRSDMERDRRMLPIWVRDAVAIGTA